MTGSGRGDGQTAVIGRCDTEAVPFNVSVMFFGPLMALFAIGGLAAVLRWTFADDRPAEPFSDDYGLLRPVAVTGTISAAEHARGVLAEAGIRATIAVGNDNLVRVLVFEHELDQARRLVG